MGPEAAEGGGAFESGEEDRFAVGGFELGQLVEVALERGDPVGRRAKEYAAGGRRAKAFSADEFCGRAAVAGSGRGPR